MLSQRLLSFTHHLLPGRALPLFLFSQIRSKQTKVQSYSKPDRSFPHSQHFVDKAHIGVRALSAEHFKIYPGENVRVTKNTSLVASVSGRIKYTHDLKRDVMVVNVLPEPREELLSEDLFRYRTEHVRGPEDNRRICVLRQKMLPSFPRALINPPEGPRPAPQKISKDGSDHWNNVSLRDPLGMEPFPFALRGELLRRHLQQCLGNASSKKFSVTDPLEELYRGKAVQRKMLIDGTSSDHHSLHHSHHHLTSFAGTSFPDSVAEGDSLTVPISNINNLQYPTQVAIGSAKQKFNEIVDTGSSKLWAPSIACKSAVCKAHHQFDPSKSTTFQADLRARPTKLTYGTGKVTLVAGRDVVSLGGHSVRQSPSTDGATNPILYPISLATSETDRPFSSLKQIDGIFGLAPTTVAAQNKIMSIYLSNDTAKQGALTIGAAIDKTHAQAPNDEPTWHPLKNERAWEVDLVDIKVGDQRMGLCSPKNPCVGLVDTGSSLITGPSRDVAKLLKLIHPSCDKSSNNSTSPPVTLILRDANGAEVEYPLNQKEYSIDFQDTKECNIGFGPLDLGHKKWAIGDTFLRRYASFYDSANKKVGFLKSRHEDESVGVVTRNSASDDPVVTYWLTEERRSTHAEACKKSVMQKVGSNFLFGEIFSSV